jgi:hypothetical protein
VKLAVLAARIDAVGKIRQQLRIEFAARECRRQFFQIDGGKIGLQAARHHRLRQWQCRALPEWKHRRDAGACKLLFAIGPDIGQEQIAEDDVGDAVPAGAGDGLAHARLVDLVRTGIGDRHDARRQAGRLTLRQQDLLPHAVDRYPAEGFSHAGQSADHVEFA